MADTPSQHKEMPDRMHIFILVQEEEQAAHRIKQPSSDQPIQNIHRTSLTKDMQQGLKGNYDYPAHCQIANRFQMVFLLHLPETQPDTDHRRNPYDSE